METEEGGRGLVGLCIEAASKSRESVEKWRRQRRTLERMPTHLADALFRRLLHRRLLYPSLLEVFQHCVEEIDLKGLDYVDAEWMAYLGAFHYLHTLNVAGCRGITNSALWPITGMASLKELNLSRCLKITDASIEHLVSISNLEKLCISETRLTSNGIMRLGSLKKLHVLDLGGLPTTDRSLRSLQGLTQLEYLDIWGSNISDEGATVLKMFPKLSYLNLAWTNVNKLPNLPSVTCLNMSNCTIHSIFEGGSTVNACLAKLFVLGTTFIDADEAFSHLQASFLSLLDLSCSSVCNFHFLRNLKALEYLDLSFGRMTDGLIECVATAGANLSYLNLSSTKVTSQGICTLAGNVPNLKTLFLSHTSVDDASLQYIGLMPSLKVIDLSNTNIKGFCYSCQNKVDRAFSLSALQNLVLLQSLNLEETLVKEEALHPLGVLTGLNHLSLKSDFLSDISLHTISSLPNLKFLGFRGAVLTNSGLHLFNPPKMLLILDLRGCWLLTEDAIYSFHKKYPQIEVKHELAHRSPVDQKDKAGSSPFQRRIQVSYSRSKLGKSSQTLCKSPDDGFADERIKYSREELLELQSPLSIFQFGSAAKSADGVGADI